MRTIWLWCYANSGGCLLHAMTVFEILLRRYDNESLPKILAKRSTNRKIPQNPEENTVQSKLSVHNFAKVHLTWKQCSTLETQSSKVVAVPHCAAQQCSVFLLILLRVLGIANNFRFHTFGTKPSGFMQFHLIEWHYLKVHHLDKRLAPAEGAFSSGVAHPWFGPRSLLKLVYLTIGSCGQSIWTKLKHFPWEKWLN